MIAVYALLVFGILFCFFGRFPGQILAYAGLLVNGNQKCSDFGNSECSIFGIKTTVLLASAVQ